MIGMSRFLRGVRGVASLEFAIIFPVFLLAALMILQMGLSTFYQSTLDDAVRIAARQIAIGNILASGRSSFVTSICNEFAVLQPSCTTNLQVYVASAREFSGIAIATVGPAGVLSNSGFAPGTASSDVVIEVAFTPPYAIPMVSNLVASAGNNTLLSVVSQIN